MSSGKAVIFCAPSGSGKTTLVRRLLKANPDLAFSISATTRPIRQNREQHGADYYFLTNEEFESKVKQDAFIEWEEVYAGTRYGTLKEEIQRLWDAGKNVIFDVDVKGALNLKKYFGDKALSVFVRVPSIEVLRERLMARGTETPETLERRLSKAAYELSFKDSFDVDLINDDIDRACAQAQRVYDQFRKKP